ncbi:MAG: phage shock protein [Patescibacteria group bacterium]|nr:phage shock protein [Patescibacteria group bacterium]
MPTLIIDVREPSEFAASHVTDAINIPLQDIARGATELATTSKDTPLIVYCRSGGRSSVALQMLKQQGFTNVTNGINQQNIENKLA